MAPRVFPRKGWKCVVVSAVATVTLLLQTSYVLKVYFYHTEDSTSCCLTQRPWADQNIRGEHRPPKYADPFRNTETKGESRDRAHQGLKAGDTSRNDVDDPDHSLNVRKFADKSSPETTTKKNLDVSPPERPSVSRVDLAMGVCGSNGSQIVGNAEKVYVYEAQKVAYCLTHKIASTFWLRVYRWLYNDTRSSRLESPLLMSKYDTHLLPFRKLKVRDVSDDEDRVLVEASYRFLFTRDPYARLWSVYIDKFVLPDNYFWTYHAPRIKSSVYKNRAERSVRTKSQDNQVQTSSADGKVEENQATQLFNRRKLSHIQYKRNFSVIEGRNRTNVYGLRGGLSEHVKTLFGRSVKSDVRSSCPEVTFHEMLQHIVNVATYHTAQDLDDHFRPVHYGCNPCKFQPHFIGHMETMKHDSTHVLRQMKLEKIVPEMSVNRVEREIDMLVTFNFDLVVRIGLQSSCVTKTDLERRLITAFVYNGYIPVESESLLEERLPLGEVDLKKAVLDLYHSSGRTSGDIRKQRERFRLEAFRQIPPKLLSAIQEVFYWDFALFGYDPSPKELFGGSE
ncbi:hypothetical protein ACOMHN_044421 [Nucella lapillus]